MKLLFRLFMEGPKVIKEYFEGSNLVQVYEYWYAAGSNPSLYYPTKSEGEYTP